MADVMYVIGAKDQASSVLKGVDTSMGRLEKSTKDLGDTSERSFGKLNFSITSLAKAAGIFGAISLAAQGVRSVFSMIGQGVDDFDAATESVRALDQAMELNGGSSESLLQANTDLADALERTTNIAAEETQELMKQAAVLGVNNDELDNMAVAAIGLSEALGVSLEDGLKKARLATEGNFKAFEKLLPAIKEMKTDEEKLAAVMELSARGMAMKEAASQSAGGEAERMSHRVGNLIEQVGTLIAPLRELAYKGITLLADALSNVLGPAIESSAEFFKQWEPVIIATIESAVNGVISGLTMAEVIFNNFGAVVDLVFASIQLRYESYRADTEHLFVTTLPAYIGWFADNFFNIIETAYNAVYQVIYSATTKIIDTMKALWDFIASGGSTDLLGQLGEISGRSYLEGFQSSIESIPEVAARALTAKEQELSGKIGSISTGLAEEFNRKFADRAVKLGENVGESLADTVELSLKKGEEEAKKKDVGKVLGNASNKGANDDAVLQAAESRLLTRGPGTRKQTVEGLLEQIVNGNKQIAASSEAATSAAESSARELAMLRADLAGSGVLIGAPP